MTRFLAGLAVTGALLLAGCASGPPKPAVPETLGQGEGVLVVKVIGVQPLSVFNAKWGSLTLVEEGTGRRHQLQDSAPLNTGHSMFAAPVPQGRWRIAGFDTAGPAPATWGVLPALIIMGLTSDSATLGSQMGSFSVRPGSLTNLGVIVSALPADKTERLQIAVLDDAQAQASVLADTDPATRQRVRALPARGWDTPANAAAAGRALELVRTRASSVSSLATTADGRLFMGSALGLVHVLEAATGRWSTLSTGGLDTIVHVQELPGGRLFAGADSGRYFLREASGQWLARDLGTGDRILHVESLGARGYALVTQPPVRPGAVGELKQRILYKAELSDNTAPREILALPGFSATGRLPVHFNGRELLVAFNHVGISRTADLYRIDPATLASRTEKLDHWLMGLYAPAPGLLVRERMNGMTLYADISTDNGVNWLRQETGNGPHTMRLRDSRTGYGLSTVSTGWSTVTLALNRTVNGGRQWTRVGTPIEASGPSEIRVLGDRVLVYTGRQLLSTTNEGASWQVEWPQQATRP